MIGSYNNIKPKLIADKIVYVSMAIVQKKNQYQFEKQRKVFYDNKKQMKIIIKSFSE